MLAEHHFAFNHDVALWERGKYLREVLALLTKSATGFCFVSESGLVLNDGKTQLMRQWQDIWKYSSSSQWHPCLTLALHWVSWNNNGEQAVLLLPHCCLGPGNQVQGSNGPKAYLTHSLWQVSLLPVQCHATWRTGLWNSCCYLSQTRRQWLQSGLDIHGVQVALNDQFLVPNMMAIWGFLNCCQGRNLLPQLYNCQLCGKWGLEGPWKTQWVLTSIYI